MTSKPRAAAFSARAVAETALARVFADGAFAAAALEAEIERHPQIDPRDRALATELVYGALRVAPWLEGRLDSFATRSVKKLRPRVRAALVLAAYQIAFLDRVPVYAAVSEAVASARQVSGDKVGGFANAILRKLARECEVARPSAAAAMEASLPPWLARRLVDVVSTEGLPALLGADASAPPLGLRVRHEGDRAAALERLRSAHPEASFEPGTISPLAILARRAGRPSELEGVKDGSLVVQEEGSQLVGLALGAKAGERVLDACAGRGHKTGILLHAVGREGAVDASDLHEPKLERLAAELAGEGVTPRATYPVDWSVGGGDVPGDYDAILVDAPCSGTGTLRRRPDLLVRRTESDIASLAQLQVAIVRNAAAHLRPGGRLVYAVCSVLRDEAEGVLAALVPSDLGLEPDPFEGPAGRIFAGATQGRLLPHLHGTDGYFVARFRKRA